MYSGTFAKNADIFADMKNTQLQSDTIFLCSIDTTASEFGTSSIAKYLDVISFKE